MKLVKPSSKVMFTDRSKAVLHLWILFVIMFLSVMLSCLFIAASLVVTCWERFNLLALLYVMFSCIFGAFQCGVLGQVWYLIVLIPVLCIVSYFKLLIYH